MIVVAQLFADNVGKVYNWNCPNCIAQYINLNSETDTILGQYYIAPHKTGGWKLPNPNPTGVYGEVTVTKVMKSEGNTIKTYYINGTQGAVENAFSSCCGTSTIAITPASLVCVPTEVCPPATNTCGVISYNFYLLLPLAISPTPQLGYQIYFTQNGSAPLTSPTFNAADGSDALAWVQANWGSYGTWTLVTNTLTTTTYDSNNTPITTTTTTTQLSLSSTTVYCGSLTTNQNSASYYISLSGINASTFNQVQENGNTATLPSTLTVANTSGGATALVAALAPYLADGTVGQANSGSNYYITYSGVGFPQALLLNGVSVTTFIAGIAP